MLLQCGPALWSCGKVLRHGLALWMLSCVMDVCRLGLWSCVVNVVLRCGCCRALWLLPRVMDDVLCCGLTL